MSGTKGIICTFSAFGETGQAAFLTQGPDTVAPARQNLMGVALVTHVKDQFVSWCIKDSVDRCRKLDHTQRRPKVTAGLGDSRYNLGTDLIGQSRQRSVRHPSQIRRSGHGVEKRGMGAISHVGTFVVE